MSTPWLYHTTDDWQTNPSGYQQPVIKMQHRTTLATLFTIWSNIECIVPENNHAPTIDGFMIWTVHTHPAPPPTPYCYENTNVAFSLSFLNCGFRDLPPLQNFQWPSVVLDIFWTHTMHVQYCKSPPLQSHPHNTGLQRGLGFHDSTTAKLGLLCFMGLLQSSIQSNQYFCLGFKERKSSCSVF